MINIHLLIGITLFNTLFSLLLWQTRKRYKQQAILVLNKLRGEYYLQLSTHPNEQSLRDWVDRNGKPNGINLTKVLERLE